VKRDPCEGRVIPGHVNQGGQKQTLMA
jgi:hypothetical protein